MSRRRQADVRQLEPDQVYGDVVVAALLDPAWRVEIEVEAIVDPERAPQR